jgi:hypothetical protein
MSLGANGNVCKNEFIEAMRIRLESDTPGLGATMDKPDAQKNLIAFGTAVHRINTIHAEVVSNSTTDAEFWQWIAKTNAWLSALSAWQEGTSQAFANWTPTQPTEKALKVALMAVPQPGNPPTPVPTLLKGKIQ